MKIGSLILLMTLSGISNSSQAEIMHPGELKTRFFPEALHDHSGVYGKSETQSKCLMQYIEADSEVGALIWDEKGDQLQFLTISTDKMVRVEPVVGAPVAEAKQVAGNLLIMDGIYEGAGRVEVWPISSTSFELRFLNKEGQLTKSCRK